MGEAAGDLECNPLVSHVCLWRERNGRCFDGKDLRVVKLKYLLLNSLSLH